MPKTASLVAVQMQYRLEDYRSAEAFRERVLGVMRAVRQRAPKGDLVVVFPEDVGLGLIFTQDFRAGAERQDDGGGGAAPDGAVSNQRLRE
jgi:hypothetical protein